MIDEVIAEIFISSCIFENHHKILCALEELLLTEGVKLSRTIEIDETFELESQKGSKNIKRKARKRGGSPQYRGLSHEQVYIVTTTDRNGHEIIKVVGYGKPITDSVQENFSGMLIENSIIHADGAFCYDQLAEISRCTQVQLKTHTSYNSVEHINTVNYIH